MLNRAQASLFITRGKTVMRYFKTMFTNNISTKHPGFFSKGPVCRDNPVITIYNNKALVNAIKDAFYKFFTFQQFCFRLLEFGNVLRDLKFHNASVSILNR